MTAPLPSTVPHIGEKTSSDILPLQAKQKLPPGIDLVKADDFREWQVDIRVLDSNPLYLNQTFRLSFIFSESYPIGMSAHLYKGQDLLP